MSANYSQSNLQQFITHQSLTKEFKVSMGLKQGDHLSPFLFVIVSKGLTGLVKKEVLMGEFSGFSVEGKYLVDVLQFADDTLLVGNGEWMHVWALKEVLRGFEVVSVL